MRGGKTNRRKFRFLKKETVLGIFVFLKLSSFNLKIIVEGGDVFCLMVLTVVKIIMATV